LRVGHELPAARVLIEEMVQHAGDLHLGRRCGAAGGIDQRLETWSVRQVCGRKRRARDGICAAASAASEIPTNARAEIQAATQGPTGPEDALSELGGLRIDQ